MLTRAVNPSSARVERFGDSGVLTMGESPMRTKAAMLQKAAEIRVQAEACKDRTIKTELLVLAARYQSLADHHERDEAAALASPLLRTATRR
jgi:hypothetical protein